MRPEGDPLTARLRDAWERVQGAADSEAAQAQLDGAIRAAGREGLDAMGVRLESGVEFDLAQHVLDGGSTSEYLLRKKQRLE